MNLNIVEYIDDIAFCTTTDQKDDKLVEILKNFLPEPVSPDEIDILIDDAIEAIGATSSKDMGQVMGHLKSTIQGRADMQEVSKIVKLRLH